MSGMFGRFACKISHLRDGRSEKEIHKFGNVMWILLYVSGTLSLRLQEHEASHSFYWVDHIELMLQASSEWSARPQPTSV